MTGERILLQNLLRQHRRPVEALAHVGRPARHMDAYTGRDHDLGAATSSAVTIAASTFGAMFSSASTVRPLPSRTSMMPARRRSLIVRSAGSAAAAARRRLPPSPGRLSDSASGVRMRSPTVFGDMFRRRIAAPPT